MATWNYSKCDVCAGRGTLRGMETCPACQGFGYFEFIAERNNEALEALINEAPTEEAKATCNRRLADLTPDNVHTVLTEYGEGYVFGNDDEVQAFTALHNAGATRWGWAWLHANRFAIELCRLNGGDYVRYRLAVSKLAWKWLEEEGQQKVVAPS